MFWRKEKISLSRKGVIFHVWPIDCTKVVWPCVTVLRRIWDKIHYVFLILLRWYIYLEDISCFGIFHVLKIFLILESRRFKRSLLNSFEFFGHLKTLWQKKLHWVNSLDLWALKRHIFYWLSFNWNNIFRSIKEDIVNKVVVVGKVVYLLSWVVLLFSEGATFGQDLMLWSSGV